VATETSAADCWVCSHGVARVAGSDFICGNGPLADDLLTGKTMSIEEATVYNMWEIVAIGECTDSLNLRILCRQRRMTEILKVRHASTTN
jgi:hypothetical protein